MLAFFKERGYESGERLPSERALAERFGVGRNALREALSTLSALRVVESRPNSGIYLRRMSTDSSFETIVLLTEMGSEPSMKEVKETLEVRWALEMRAVQLACERRTEADLDSLASIIEATRAVLANKGNISAQDTAFHIALARSTHNDVLVRLLNSFYRISESRRFALFADPERGALSAAQHERLYEAIRKRDLKKATAMMETHFARAVEAWSEVLGDEKDPERDGKAARATK
ncbi:DNA-binding FadR family transcriptional regulator [Paraburkholderia caballeronis]|uniref:DNA-binding transcriptional regulator, FadR family n=2 Tax=Paraburkholderia caballeronis TaxID=416943 RepID=A0A1H7M1M8_9BURK|nr:DNA-binding FadR family transcriptional regulator [Paraburkholderia caballeronis]PXX04046.1 DNA-binding FadR family transcriptional regulator [Paraburkholderia caballeronis]RAK04790.1 DNA-binding FadR family transcriptional regulator [Paraburkholderia caballeronis]TDV19691.1 DNA-binding FadR family transcriptional regulator [Paraburkholderia caballeronis]TDV22290.1 DNA-binding FadR family transcriptional regulator [Paraburkholderia caballeronis]